MEVPAATVAALDPASFAEVLDRLSASASSRRSAGMRRARTG
jgi:hypothetical protein